jgi:hypothetical protein
VERSRAEPRRRNQALQVIALPNVGTGIYCNET